MKSYIAPIIVTDENGEKAVLYPETKVEAVHGLEERLADLNGASIATTTETTLPNSYVGRLLIVEMIGGEIEQSTSPTFTSPQEITRTMITSAKAYDDNGNSTVVPFSKPFELYNKNGNYDIFVNGKMKRKYMKKVFNGSEAWSQSSAMATRFYVDNMKCKAFGLVYCSHAKGLTQEATNEDECYLSGSNNGLFVINTNFLTVSAFKDWLSSNPMTVIYELAEETIEELPLETQIALNSILTYDGITYVEFVSEVQPTFHKFKYGTSVVGGYALESLLTARNNDLRLSSLEASVVNNI